MLLTLDFCTARAFWVRPIIISHHHDFLKSPYVSLKPAAIAAVILSVL